MGILRALFAISVVFAHCPWHSSFVFVGGRNAVQLFYMISGFLITHILHNTPAYRENTITFYKSRALRIYPIYYVVAALTLLAVVSRQIAIGHTAIGDVFHAVPLSAKALLAASNLALFGQDWVMFTAVHGGHLQPSTNFWDSDVLVFHGLLVPQAWTLGVELTFYLIAPFVLLRRRRIVALLAASLLLRFLFFLYFPDRALSDPWTYRFFPFELSLFLVGALSQQLMLPLWQRYRHRLKAANYATWAFAAGAMLYFLIPVNEIASSAILMIAFFLILPLTFLFQNKYSFDRKIGELSYPIYIGHVFVIIIASPLTRLWANHALIYALSNVALAVAFAIMLNKYVALPIERYRKQLKNRTRKSDTVVDVSATRSS
jgi:peptidoglycan/LPS O-acetylase OafA/YrhL